MLKKIKINNFQGIDKAEISFGKLNVLLTENNCGVNPVLNAIKWFVPTHYYNPQMGEI